MIPTDQGVGTIKPSFVAVLVDDLLPLPKSSCSAGYMIVSILSGSDAPWANMGRISGDPKDQVCSDWLKTESKLTGFICQPVFLRNEKKTKWHEYSRNRMQLSSGGKGGKKARFIPEILN